MQKAQRYFDRTRTFVREYTAGLNVRDLRRLFDQDAVQAYAVLARDEQAQARPAEPFRRFLWDTRVVFLGVARKLSPARRLLFTAAILFALLGFLHTEVVRLGTPGFALVFGAHMLWFLLSIAGLVFLLIVELVDRVRVRDELEVARELQRELLPRSAPRLAGYRFAHSYRTANEVGGDYYDFPVLPDGRVALLAGDASGHGIAAGLLMAIANATLKTALDVDPDPARVAALLNRALYRTGDRRAFMTLFYGLLEPGSGRIDFVCAGHPFPLLRRAGGAIEELGHGGLPLGIHDEPDVPVGATGLGAGDLLVLYTDGLPEAVGRGDGEAFGFRRLRELLREPGSPATAHKRILAAFDRHMGGEAPHDDITLVIVGREPGA